MKGMRVGYVRVSSVDQNIDRQLESLQVDKLFIDKASGKDVNRDQFQAMLDFVREGDSVFVHSMDRMARNLDDLRKTVKHLIEKGVQVHFIKENLTFNGNDSPISLLLRSVLGAFSEFERSLIRERQREGLALARSRNVYKGKKRILNKQQEKELFEMMERGDSRKSICEHFKISRQLLYAYIRRNKEENSLKN